MRKNNKKKRRLSVFVKLFITLMVAFILPITIFYPMASQYLIKEIINSYSKNIEMKMDDYYSDFEDSVEKLENIAINTSLEQEMQRDYYTKNIMDTKSAMDCMNRYIANIDFVRNVYVLAKDSDYYFSPYTTYTPERFYEYSDLREQRAQIDDYLGAKVMTPRFLKAIKKGKRTIIPVMCSVNTDFHEKQSVLIFMVDCKKTIYHQDYMVRITTDTGDTIYSSVDEDIIKLSQPDTSLKATASDNCHIYKDYNLHFGNAKVELFYNYTDFSQSLYRIFITLYIGVIALLVLGLVLTFILAKLNYLPMRAINALIKQNDDKKQKVGNEFTAITDYITNLQGRYAEISSKQSANSPLLLEYYTRQLLTNSITYSDKNKKAYSEAGLELNSKHYRCISLRFSRTMRDNAIAEHKAKIQSFADAVDMVMYTYSEATYIYMLCGYDDPDAFHAFTQKLLLYLERRSCGVAAIGNETSDDTHIYKSLTQSKNAMDYRFAALNQRIIFYGHIERMDPTSFRYPEELINKVLYCVMHPENLKLAMGELNDFIKSNELNFSTVRMIYQELVNSALKTAYTKTGAMPAELYTYSVELLHMESIDSLSNMLYEFFSTCHRIIGDENSCASKVRRYVDEHLLDASLSVQAIAWNLDITPQYLSSTFKKETGMRVIEYITRQRVDYICHMLVTTKQSISSIIAGAGYADASSFSKKFKQLMGMTPGEYRKLNS